MTILLLSSATTLPIKGSLLPEPSTTVGVVLVALLIAALLAERGLRLRQRLREDQLGRIEFEVKREERLSELDGVRHVRAVAEAARQHDDAQRSSSQPAVRLRAASQGGEVFEDVGDALAGIQQRVAWQDLGVDTDEVVIPRYLPVSIYVNSSDPRDFYALRDAVERFLDEFGFEVASELQAKRGSIFQRITAKLKEPSTKEELRRQIALAQLALQQQTLGKAQAEINLQGAQAAAALAQTLATSDDCVVAFGAMIGATQRDEQGRRRTVIVELTPEELMQFQRGGRALHNARAAFEMLARLRPDEYLRQTSDGDEDDPGLRAGDNVLTLPPGA